MIMAKWVKKAGYETLLLAGEKDLDSAGAEAQLVRFRRGKYSHFHKKKTELFYFTAGSGRAIIGGVEKRLGRGSWLLVPPNVIHKFVNEAEAPLEAIMLKTNSRRGDTYK